MYDEDLNNLEDWLRRLKIEYEVYFNGNRKRPPDDLRARVDILVKRLSEASNMTFPQRFRFSTLVARYYLFRDLWRRTQQESELGKNGSGCLGAKRRTSGEEVETPQPPSEIHISITDPNLEEEKVQRLFQAIQSMREQNARSLPEISYEQFLKYIATQTQTIRRKYLCASVTFTLAREQEAIKFIATAENKTQAPEDDVSCRAQTK
jgi:hypothetical protein